MPSISWAPGAFLPLLGLHLLATGCAARKEPKPGPAASTSSPATPSLPPSPRGTSEAVTCPLKVMPAPGDASATIQNALDAASAGDCAEVQLSAGIYDIKAPIHLRSHVRLSGQGFRSNLSMIRPTIDFHGRALLTTDYDRSTRERKQSNVQLEKIHLRALAKCNGTESCATAAVGLWLDKTAYPVVRDCMFSGFPDGGAAIRGGGVLYLKVESSTFVSIYGWSIDLSTEFAPRMPGSHKPATYYAVSVGNIERNYFASRRGVRVEPGFAVTVRSNQFEGGLSMVHAFRTASSVFAVESNYFEVSRTPEDVPDRGTIALRGTGRVVGNLINGPVRGGEPFFVGPGVDIIGSEAMTIADNTIRCFDPGVRVRGTLRGALTQFGNVIAPKKRVRQAWDAPIFEQQPDSLAPDDDSEDPAQLPLTSPHP